MPRKTVRRASVKTTSAATGSHRRRAGSGPHSPGRWGCRRHEEERRGQQQRSSEHQSQVHLCRRQGRQPRRGRCRQHRQGTRHLVRRADARLRTSLRQARRASCPRHRRAEGRGQEAPDGADRLRQAARPRPWRAASRPSTTSAPTPPRSCRANSARRPRPSTRRPGSSTTRSRAPSASCASSCWTSTSSSPTRSAARPMRCWRDWRRNRTSCVWTRPTAPPSRRCFRKSRCG